MPRYVYEFGAGKADGRGDQTKLLGGKGAGLAEMTALGIPVPPGFTLTTEVCSHTFENEGEYPEKLQGQVTAALQRLGELTESGFGDPTAPLLISVRSGAAISMPGMMDTILNLGLNDETVKALATQTGDPRFAYDCYRRFVAMYGDVVMGVSGTEEEDSPFVTLLEDQKREAGVTEDKELSADQLKNLVVQYKIEILRRREVPFPESPLDQLWGAIGAVFASFNNARAVAYRRMQNLDDTAGTAVNIQAMVFGNLGEDSGSGVAFTRDPSTGAPGLFGEYLLNCQGEDVVAGIRTPEVIAKLGETMPDVLAELTSVGERLEKHFGDMQDLEFTIQRGQLWLLQTRTGKRSGAAMIRIAVDLVASGVLDEREAIRRVSPGKLAEVLHPTIDPETRPDSIARGLPASPGAAIGRLVFTATEAEEWAQRGEQVILARIETSPEDIHGMKAAVGILTVRGGMTSHAAVVARGLGKSAVVGCSSAKIDLSARKLTAGGKTLLRGDVVTLDGSTGEVFAGTATLIPAQLSESFHTFMGWVDELRRLRVRTNADTAAEARTARAFGAEGIGLCRTEHMFFAPERILAVRKMILATSEEGRAEALAAILPMQKSDFIDIFRVMEGMPVTVRLLDPPLHEFLPHTSQEIAQVAKDLGEKPEVLAELVSNLREHNPMLGHRGCRLAISYPAIYRTQAQAIAEAAAAIIKEGGQANVEIMIPFVSLPRELKVLRKHVCEVVDAVFAEAEVELPYAVGTMIELPRACLVADKVAAHADFFSFGTNDLTQTTYGLSRDDAGRFLPDYLKHGLLGKDPFVVLDRSGVGALLRIAVEKGRKVKTKLKVGICGEHGGDPASVEFCHIEGFDYVSCSPFRVPIARVAAARAALRGETRAK